MSEHDGIVHITRDNPRFNREAHARLPRWPPSSLDEIVALYGAKHTKSNEGDEQMTTIEDAKLTQEEYEAVGRELIRLSAARPYEKQSMAECTLTVLARKKAATEHLSFRAALHSVTLAHPQLTEAFRDAKGMGGRR